MATKIFRSLLSASLLFTLHAADKPVLPDLLDPDKQPLLQLKSPMESSFVRTGPTIQVAILLDTSNSMDGLIDQAKTQVWKIVNALSEANKHKKEIVLQVGLFEYGKSSLPVSRGYLQMLSPLTNDLDFLSEKLFGLRTNGGYEYAGWAIDEAVDRLQWSKHVDDLRLIIIAGNEEFDQGSRSYVRAIKEARRDAIVVNTIFCGDRQTGIRSLWKDGAVRGGGVYMNIDHNVKIHHVDSPYDDEIVRLGNQLNDTYIAYGAKGKKSKSRQMAQDTNAMRMSKSALIQRNVAKTTKQYKTESWDLASAYEADEEVVSNVAEAQMPAPLRGKSDKEVKRYLNDKLQERKDLQKQINAFKAKRDAYVKANQPKSQKDFGTVLIENVRKIAMKNGFSFK